MAFVHEYTYPADGYSYRVKRVEGIHLPDGRSPGNRCGEDDPCTLFFIYDCEDDGDDWRPVELVETTAEHWYFKEYHNEYIIGTGWTNRRAYWPNETPRTTEDLEHNWDFRVAWRVGKITSTVEIADDAADVGLD